MDWDNDGKLDIISGCYWTDGADGAHMQILTGNGDMDFAAAKILESASGQPLQNVAEIDNKNQVQAICTEQHAVDYDDDGDLDLVVGCFGSNFYYYENQAEPNGANAIVDSPVELPIAISGHHAAPHLVDWDNDGDLDLLSGTASGGVLLSENTGSRAKPTWAEFESIVPKSTMDSQNADSLALGASTRVWATDWNGDGWQDLVIGDGVTVSSPATGVSKEEWEKRLAEDDKKMQALSEKMTPFYEQLEKLAAEGKEPEGELADQIEQIQEEMTAIYDGKSEYDASKSTGHVWLLIRKPPSDGKLTSK